MNINDSVKFLEFIQNNLAIYLVTDKFFVIVITITNVIIIMAFLIYINKDLHYSYSDYPK